MSRLHFFAAVSLVVVSVIGVITSFRLHDDPGVPQLDAPHSKVETKHQESAGLCPWRDPEGDRNLFFPGSTSVREETLVLSHEHFTLEQKLGHTSHGDDNAIQIHRILQGTTSLGVIITRRVRGESGVIELVLAVGIDGKVIGAKLQRLIEPDKIASFLRSEAFLGAFRGKTADSPWNLDVDKFDFTAEERSSAIAILDGAHTALVMLEVGTKK